MTSVVSGACPIHPLEFKITYGECTPLKAWQRLGLQGLSTILLVTCPKLF